MLETDVLEMFYAYAFQVVGADCPIDKDTRKRNSICPYFLQGRANHEVQTVNWNTGIFEAESA